MRRAALVLGVVLAGCGGDEDSAPGDRLVGAWGLAFGDDCAGGYVFGADGDYDLRFGCFSAVGDGFDMEIYSGSWTADGERIHLEPYGGSCPPDEADGAAEPASIRYALQDGGRTLRTTSPEGAVYYERFEDDGMPSEGGTAITFGCFTPDGFQPRAFERW